MIFRDVMLIPVSTKPFWVAVTRPSTVLALLFAVPAKELAASALLLAVPANELADFAVCSTTLYFAWSELRVNSAALNRLP